jgi:esterase
MPHIQLPDIRLYYEEHGEGVPILCVHGTSGSAMTWESSIDELTQLGRVIVYDRRGCTRSERPDPYPTTSVSEHADDSAALLETLSATPAIVIGRSYGGAIAIDLALRYPAHVRALVLLEPGDVNLSPGMQEWADDMTRGLESAADEGIDTVAEALLRNVLGDASWEQFPDPMKQMFTDNSPAILAEFRGGAMPGGAASLAAINVPVLLVAATDSPEMFRQETDAIATAIPGSRTVLIGGGHLVNPSAPPVLEFIGEILSGSVPRAAAMPGA